MFSPRLNIFRLTSMSLMIYSVYLFTRNEKAVKDLKDFTNTGISDLLDYGTEWSTTDNILGNKTNTEKTFKEKVKDTMDVDVDVDVDTEPVENDDED